eukprot:TRINITY_DN4414_c1_g3_i3.p1 TRINITY_DN4414_c1_g3~~TRINITY_DN4414_c1_g3_i3.p1  ORF type:complete len:453 (+),score=51.33 TRINITY_DN4414_c1_g3_i3:96-1454(+)
METLPSQVMEEILSRLEDASDLCRFMATSRAMRSISKRIHSLRFYCSYSYLLASRKNPQVPPFRPWVSAMLLKLVDLKKLRFDMEESMQKLLYEDEDGDRSDCWLTDPNFVMEWLPHVSSSLISLSITDFWQQSCWRCSNVLSLISGHCRNLTALELKNAWLSVEGMQNMNTLTSLTLEFIRLNDETLSAINKCFPALEILRLIQVGGLTYPHIQMPKLRVCHWRVSNTPSSLTIDCTSLSELKLECFSPHSLTIKAPSLSFLHISLKKPGRILVETAMPNLTKISISCHDIGRVLDIFSRRDTITELFVELSVLLFDYDGHCHGLHKRPEDMLSLDELQSKFPSLSTLSVGPGAWYMLEEQLDRNNGSGYELEWDCLRKLTIHIALLRVESAFKLLRKVLGVLPALADIAIYVYSDNQIGVQDLIFRAQKDFSHVKWKWHHSSSGFRHRLT